MKNLQRRTLQKPIWTGFINPYSFISENNSFKIQLYMTKLPWAFPLVIQKIDQQQQRFKCKTIRFVFRNFAMTLLTNEIGFAVISVAIEMEIRVVNEASNSFNKLEIYTLWAASYRLIANVAQYEIQSVLYANKTEVKPNIYAIRLSSIFNNS